MAIRHAIHHAADPNVAEIAALIGDPVRASMLFALLAGGDLPASELAFRAGASPQACSAHLKKLVAAGLLSSRAAGRQRLFRLASPGVAHAMEALAAISPPARVVALAQSTEIARLREARSCYDHLAGRLGVAVTERFMACGALRLAAKEFELTPSGEKLLSSFGVDVDAARSSRRNFARVCIDWTERRPHLSGSLGAQVLECFVGRKWVARNKGDRSLRITPQGRTELEKRFSIRLG